MTTATQTRDIHDLITAGTVKAPPRKLDQGAKEKAGDDGTPVTISEGQYVQPEDGNPFVSFEGTLGDEEVTFALGMNGRRDQFLDSLLAALVDGPISGLRFKTYRGGQGKARVELEPA